MIQLKVDMKRQILFLCAKREGLVSDLLQMVPLCCEEASLFFRIMIQRSVQPFIEFEKRGRAFRRALKKLSYSDCNQ